MSVESGVLVIHCSDPRFQDAFHEFLHGHLGLERYALLAVPGGPQFLTLAEYLPKFSWTGWRWVKFLGDLGNTDRVILIAHEDCRWCQDSRFSGLHNGSHDHQVEDLHHVSAAIGDRFPSAHVELYYAHLTQNAVSIDAA